MAGVSFLLPVWFDFAAVFLCALTGGVAATQRGYDVVGAFVLAFVTGVGARARAPMRPARRAP